MSFTVKQLVFLFLEFAGFGLIVAGVVLYDGETISFALCAEMCLAGVPFLIVAFLFCHYKMRCSHCHQPYPTIEWWGMEYCPYCGKYYD